MSLSAVHVVVPASVDDPERPSGGNVFDLELAAGLAELGWQVEVHRVPGAWPRADDGACRELSRLLCERIREDDIVLVDGLVGCG
ncbi:hypothetical protein [Streptomyces sp. NPDC005438]|uniref:hypothetical protein n=1 Tax=Streptomyces sp. NPDC005438 TaxID=3156880 RepID=UPI00339ED528